MVSLNALQSGVWKIRLGGRHTRFAISLTSGNFFSPQSDAFDETISKVQYSSVHTKTIDRKTIY
jgi:hypothetical protein